MNMLLTRLRAEWAWLAVNPVAVLGACLLLVVASFAWMQHRNTALKNQVAQLALERTNADAVASVTHGVQLRTADSIRWLGDSLQMVQRLVVQRVQERDSVDHALNQTRTAKVALEVKVDSLRVRQLASTSDVKTDSASGERSGSFHVRQVPYTADARVVLPAHGRGRLDLSVSIDSAAIRARLGCGVARDGIRPAMVTLETPVWLHATVSSAEQDVAMCNAQLVTKQRWRPALAIGPAYSVVHLPDGTWRSGWGISGQLSLLHWP